MLTKFCSTTLAISLFTLSAITSVEAASDNCMVGKWKPDSAQLKKQFEQASKQVVGSVSGQTTLNFNKNGSGSYQLNNFTLSMSSPGAPMLMTLIMNGNSQFNWSTQNKQFSIKNEKVNIQTSGSINIGGMKMPIPSIPISDKQASSGISNGGYSCSGNKLTFKPQKKGTLLNVWHRI